jgi:NADPH:quinone reductase-like Zn-dependent oxidoreductase
MRAAVVTHPGSAPAVADRPDPEAAPGTVVVRVTAAALNPVDLLISSGAHPLGAPPSPHVPGVEAVGHVVAGDALTPGTRVRVTVPGGFVSGTLAELVAAPAAACVPLTGDLDGLDDDLAAAIGIVGVGALIALRDRAALTAGESVLVLGATGGLGQALVHIAAALGADRILAVGRDEARLKALAGKVPGVVPIPAGPATFATLVAEAGDPVNVVADALWGPYAPPALACLASGGRFVNIGQCAQTGDAPGIDAARLRHSSLTLTGLSGAGLPPATVAAAYRDVAALAAQGALDLALDVRPLDDIAAAWQAQAGSPGAKIVLRP